MYKPTLALALLLSPSTLPAIEFHPTELTRRGQSVFLTRSSPTMNARGDVLATAFGVYPDGTNSSVL